MPEAVERKLYEIAAEIRKDWGEQGQGIYFGAKPYLYAMEAMDNVDQEYGVDSGASIVAYFLANAQMWRGEVARRVKKELNAMLKRHREKR